MFEYPSYVNRSKILRLNNQAFLKGDVGEIIVKHKVHWCHRTRELSPTYLETRENFVIADKMKTFLQKYWYTIDLFKFVVENKRATNLELYEVKTRNMLSKSYIKYPVPAVTTRTMNAYKEALALGFKVIHAEVQLYENWEYYINFRKFRPEDFMIHDGSPYFAKRTFNSRKKINPFESSNPHKAF